MAMMCWENSECSLGKEPYKETDDQEERADKEMQKIKDEDEHVNSTLHTGNQLKILFKEFSWGMEDNASTLETQEMAQWQLVYISNLENDLQKHGTKVNEEEGQKDKRPAAKNMLFERPSLINPNHSSKMYEESGSENDNVEESKKRENEKNTRELAYTSIGSYKRGKQAKQ